MQASSRDPYGVGFREVEIVEEDKCDYGKYSIGYNPEKVKEYLQRIKGTDVHERRKMHTRAWRRKQRQAGYNSGGEWQKQNKQRTRETNRLACRTYSMKHPEKIKAKSKIMCEIYASSGYSRIRGYLYNKKMKPPINFTMSYKTKSWAWTFAHP